MNSQCPNSEPVVLMKNIVKVYPDGTIALQGVDFELCRGEIHGLLGENGAGKSTLMKILAGLIKPTRGEVVVRGRPVKFHSPADALKQGIGIVMQGLSLVPVFTAYENIILGARRVKPSREEIEKLMQETGLIVPLDTPVENLSFGVRQKIEILKMLALNVDILILDEPTTNLSPTETRDLFKTLLKLKEQGKSIVLITHKIREIYEATDRVTVLRKGRLIGTVETSKVTPRDLAKMMVGREVELSINKPPSKPGETALKVEDLEVLGDLGVPAVRGVSFEVRYGEIFGIAGVEGNGQIELAEAIVGMRKPVRGRIILDNEEITVLDTSERYKRGIAYVPEDRKTSLIMEFSLVENTPLTEITYSREIVGKMGFIRMKQLIEKTTKIVREYNVITPSIYTSARALSGGNQQRFIVGRELSKDPKVIIVAQPTRGLDVAATEYVRNLLVEMRSKGKAVILISSDLDEVLSLSDRLAVMYNGRFMGIVDPSRITDEELGLMMGGYTYEEIKAQRV